MRTCWSVCSNVFGHFRGVFFPQKNHHALNGYVCLYLCVCGVRVCGVEGMIGSLRRSVPITSSSGVQLQFSFMTFLAQRPRCMAPAVTDRCVWRQHFSAQRPRHRKSPDSSDCLGAFTRATGTTSALCTPTRLSFPLSVSPYVCVFLVGCILSATSACIKKSLSTLFMLLSIFKDRQKLRKSAPTGV